MKYYPFQNPIPFPFQYPFQNQILHNFYLFIFFYDKYKKVTNWVGGGVMLSIQKNEKITRTVPVLKPNST